MSRKKRRTAYSGTAKQMLAAEETPIARQEAERAAAEEAVMQIETNSNPAHAPVAAPPLPERPQAMTASAPPPAADALHGSLGKRLRAAREAKGWSAEEVGTRLRLPLQIIQTLEAEQYEKIGYGIYLRGYLTSYARLVDVPAVLVDPVLRDRSQTPPLVASGTISHSRYLYQRYSVSALYLILTGVIIVPAVLLAMRAGMQPAVPPVSTLDAAVNTAPADPAETRAPAPSRPDAAPAAAPAAQTGSDTPLVASLAPFQALSRSDDPAARSEAGVAPVGTGAHTLKLSLKEASWVEVVSASGEKLEFGLLPAGSTRTYRSDKALDVRLGNCTGAEVETDGKVQDLTPYRHANVAHFKLFTGDQPISHMD